jgi:hypothetical protein
MKNKSVVFFVFMLMIIIVFSAVATTGKQEQSSLNQSTGHLGGLFTQLPSDPGLSSDDWWAYSSCAFFCGSYYQGYEMFTDVASLIQGIHWWGMSNKNDDPTHYPGDPVGMTFNIIFYKENNTKPGEIVRTYSGIKPHITSTGILYPEVPPTGLYFFECDLTPSCNLSTGWISIVSTGSDNNCSFSWLDSPTGNGNAFETKDGKGWDAPGYGFSLVLTDGTKTSLEIVNMKGGSGVTLGIKNNGNTMVDNFPVDFIVLGGIGKKIEVNAGKTISGLNSGDTTLLQTGKFFGLGKIMIFIVGDGIIAYKHGIQLFMYTIIQNT